MKKEDVDLIKDDTGSIRTHIEKLEVLEDIYKNLSNNPYPNKKERDVAKLKMQLIKKEMLLLSYLIDKDIDLINSGY